MVFPPRSYSTELTSATSRVSSPADPWKVNAEINSSQADLIMTKNKRSLRELLYEFADGTSAHGVGKIGSTAKAKSWFWCVFWVLVTLTCAGMVISQGILLLETYLDKPTKSDIDVTYVRTVQFPAVTICNLNIIRRSKIRSFGDAEAIVSTFDKFMEREPPKDGHDHDKEGAAANQSSSGSSSTSFGPPDRQKEAMKESLKIDDSNAEEHMRLSNVTVDEQAYAEYLILSTLAKQNMSDLMDAGHEFNELVFRCNWKDFSCKDGDFLKYWKRTWNWRYGNCYTFNSGATEDGKKTPVLTSTKPGPQYGLTLDLFVNQGEYIPSISQEAGVRILLTPQRSIPFPVDEGFTVSPGFSTSIGLRQLHIVRVDPFKNDSCYGHDTLEDFSVYKRFKGSKYSVQGCMYSCLAEAQKDKCKCTEGKFPVGGEICLNVTELQCVQEQQKRYDNDELGCSRRCPQPCQQMSFRTSMSNSAWAQSYEKQVQAMMRREGDTNFKNMGNDKDTLRQNFLRIKIYFEELNMEKITYSEYYAFENLMSDVGGQLGLWIGVSFITVAEVIKLLLDMIRVLARKFYLTDGEVRDIHEMK